MAKDDSKTTTDHDTIKKWVEARDGEPSVVEETEDSGSGGGLLRINFPDYDENNLKSISWDKFFEIFDDSKLEFLYQEETSDGEQSRFSKFVKKD